jgi:ATP-dependent protease ClpP protease subunit
MADPKRRGISQRSEMIYDVHNFGIILDTREIFLSSALDYHYDDAMIDHKAANTFIRNLQILNYMGSDTILVHQITNGGDWNMGIAIYDAIKNSSSETVLLAHAHARSMSSIIPQAATWRIIMFNADFLIHWGTSVLDGNFTSVQAEAEWDKKISERMLDIYLERCKEGEYWTRNGMDEQTIREWLRDQMDKKQEVYMTPREAVDKGFFDAVLGDEGFETIKSLRDG